MSISPLPSGQKKGFEHKFLGTLFTRRYEGAELTTLLLKNKADRRITTSSLLPDILSLREKGMKRREIGKKLGISIRQVEHVLRRHRKREKNAN